MQYAGLRSTQFVSLLILTIKSNRHCMRFELGMVTSDIIVFKNLKKSKLS